MQCCIKVEQITVDEYMFNLGLSDYQNDLPGQHLEIIKSCKSVSEARRNYLVTSYLLGYDFRSGQVILGKSTSNSKNIIIEVPSTVYEQAIKDTSYYIGFKQSGNSRKRKRKGYFSGIVFGGE